MMTPIHYMTDADESGDTSAVNVSPDGKTVWLPDGVCETDPEWTLKSITAVWGDEDEGWPTAAARDAMRATRVFEAVAAGRAEVDLDVDGWADGEHSAAVADARAERRHGHPSLSAAERGV